VVFRGGLQTYIHGPPAAKRERSGTEKSRYVPFRPQLKNTQGVTEASRTEGETHRTSLDQLRVTDAI